MKGRIIPIIVFLFLAPAAWSGDNRPLLIDLEQAKNRAIESSGELEALRLQLLAENYSYELGWRAFFPTVSLGLNQSDSVALFSPADTTKKSVSLSLHQPLFDGGRTLFQRKVQRLNLTLQEYAYLKKHEELVDQVWAAFYRLLLLREKLRLQEELSTLARQQLAISRKERELGAITEIDYIDTEIEYKKLEAEIRKTRIEEEALLYQFRLLCGLSPDQEIEIDGKIDFSYSGRTLILPARSWLGVALERNTEIRRLQFEAEKTKEEYRIARTTYIPTIGADFTFSLSGEGFPLSEPGFSLKITFQFPFSEAPSRLNVDASSNLSSQRTVGAGWSSEILPSLDFLADHRLALLKIRMTNLQLESAEENIRFSIEQFLKNYADETENLKLQKETLQLLDRKQRVTREQLGIGEIKRLDYLKAQNDFYRQSIAIRENILRIIQMERSFEQLLGLEAGELARFSEAVRDSDPRPRGVEP